MSDEKFSQSVTINKAASVTDIVLNDYRTADVFLKYDIEFCCGGKWPLEMVCASRGLDVTEVLRELTKASRAVQFSNNLRFHDWSTNFLIDFIINVHHEYLKTAVPVALEYVTRFMEGHLKKFPELQPLQEIVAKLHGDIPSHLLSEEEIFFPYIRQISNAHLYREPYASLLVKTLRKPLQVTMRQEHDVINKLLQQMRRLTNDYTIPDKACVTHRVTFHKLQELDNDLTQHLYLENDILFPRAIEIEKELLA